MSTFEIVETILCSVLAVITITFVVYVIVSEHINKEKQKLRDKYQEKIIEQQAYIQHLEVNMNVLLKELQEIKENEREWESIIN